ncbi:MAG: heat-inducible transcriptional repressor HrcA, partial [Desulfuromonadaceae bacterium]
ERSRRILEAIVEDYIGTAEPIGSRAVTRRHRLGLSPATVRNVMADLEELGYIISPHTSAGRVPTEKGYRFYVDTLLQVGQLDIQVKDRIERFYRLDGMRVEERLREAGKVLSAISSYAGLVMVPRFTSTVFRHIEFLKLSQGKILVVFVSRSGLVQNKVIETSQPISPHELEQIGNYLNQTLSGLTIQEIKARIVRDMAEEKAIYDRLLRRALELSREALCGEVSGQVYIEGASNILDQSEFKDLEQMKRLFRAFEQKNILIELLDKSQHAKGVQIFIGSESEYREIEGCSLIAANYSSSRGTIGTLGVIGPSRMNYSQVIPVVDYTARLVSQILEMDLEE